MVNYSTLNLNHALKTRLRIFSLMGSIIDKGPSVIFIQDTDGYIFGGFASTSWTISPQFTGTTRVKSPAYLLSINNNASFTIRF